MTKPQSNHSKCEGEVFWYVWDVFARCLGKINLTIQSFIPQLFSWGQLQITAEAFEQLLVCWRIFPGFLHVTREFGSKIRDGFPKRHIYSSRIYGHAKFPTEVMDVWDHDYGTNLPGGG